MIDLLRKPSLGSLSLVIDKWLIGDQQVAVVGHGLRGGEGGRRGW